MSGLRRVVVALDGSHSADGALALGIEFARDYATELLLCSVVDPEAAIAAASAPDGPLMAFEPILAEVEREAKVLLNAAATRAITAGARASTTLLDGRPIVAIVDFARDAGADAIVMGTHGTGGLERLLLGSVAAGVLRLTTVPTFVVRAPRRPRTPTAPVHALERILVAVDDSDPSDAAIAFAIELAAAKNSTLVFCHAVESGDLFEKATSYGYDPVPLLESVRDAAAALLSSKEQAALAEHVTVEKIVVEGDPARAVIAAAKEHRADVVVMGTHGRRGLRRLFMGSVAEDVVRHSDVPVAVVRAAADRRSG